MALAYKESEDHILDELTPEEVEANTYTPQSCGLIGIIRLNPELNKRRKKLRAIAMKAYDRVEPEKDMKLILSAEDADSWRSTLNKLDACCEFKPTHKTAIDGEVKILISALFPTDGAPKVRELRAQLPPLPEFPDLEPNSLFTKFQFELAMVMFRDEVERYIAHVCYVNKFKEALGPTFMQSPTRTSMEIPNDFGKDLPLSSAVKSKDKGKNKADETPVARSSTTPVPVPATPGSAFHQEQQSFVEQSDTDPYRNITRRGARKSGRVSGPLETPFRPKAQPLGYELPTLEEFTDDDDDDDDEQLTPKTYVPKHLRAKVGRSSMLSDLFQGPSFGAAATPNPTATINPLGAVQSIQPVTVPSAGTGPMISSGGAQPPDDDPDTSDDEGGRDPNPRTPSRHRGRRPRQPLPPPSNPVQGPTPIPTTTQPVVTTVTQQATNGRGVYFDNRIKIADVVEKWDGDPDTLASWIWSVNIVANRGFEVWNQLGQQIPLRLTGRAKDWFESQSKRYQAFMMQDWQNMRAGICDYFMNRTWLDKQKGKATRAHYREPGHANETPSDYIIRKKKLLQMVFKLTKTELILEILNGAPQYWRTIMDTSRIESFREFQATVKYHEETLISGTRGDGSVSRRDIDKIWEALKSQKQSKSKFAKTHAVQTMKPKYPPDDKNVSKKATPKSKGARPCIHCGSQMHWDNECKYHPKNMKKVKAYFSNASQEEQDDQAEYERMEAEANESDAGFLERSQSAIEDDTEKLKDVSTPWDPGTNSDETVQASGYNAFVNSSESFKFPSRKALFNTLKSLKSNLAEASQSPKTVVLQKLMARPPGATFLGSRATTVPAYLGSEMFSCSIILDSGSDITLISEKQLNALKNPPKVKSGQQVQLHQVTGKTIITGYVKILITFITNEGNVVMTVEAYVVKGMNTPFILGNDFASQYQLSLVREPDGTFIHLGDSGRKIHANESETTPRTDESGQVFYVLTRPDYKTNAEKKAYMVKRRAKQKKVNQVAKGATPVYLAEGIQLKPESIQLVHVEADFKPDQTEGFIEKLMMSHSKDDDYYGIADSIISKEAKTLQITNLSNKFIKIPKGTVIGFMTDTKTGLNVKSDLTEKELEVGQAKSNLIKSLLKKTPVPEPTEQEIELSQPVEGGPKTSELPSLEHIPKDRLLSEIHFSEDLTESQLKNLEKVVLKHHKAFGLDGRLGNYPAQVEINLREGAKEISLPPYSASPAKREVIDKQLEEWLRLDVITPSKSAWGFPVLIVYRNNKPRMCIDYRRLNEVAVPDEFPLPKQTDILHALEGSQYLTTLDALAGFTQLSIKEEDRPKTAFRCHRGLYEFTRLPFGFRNGPAVFQRVMNTILSEYLWMFTLVYIDDIVVYSRCFEEHCEHLDKVFKAIADSGLTLSPNKCHLAYKSLLLLGQKVSRLGLSTHMEKVVAILQLEPPKNVPTLRTFLGMMTYFSSYIPFYAWIVAVLFALLKKDATWKWTDTEQRAFELAKKALSSAPVMAYPIYGKPYRLYTDACDFGLAAILQQVQPVKLRDMKGTKVYKKCMEAYKAGKPVPELITPIPKFKDSMSGGAYVDSWAEIFDDTVVHVERVIAYWSRILKAAETRYSPTEREALALKEGLVKFQPYLEGAQFVAITDHAALTWSRTFQNVNTRLSSWGLKKFKTRYTGYGPEEDKWLTRQELRNAPEVLMEWEKLMH
ncbi:Retrovirus-related Pol polyprotein from transposon [Ceratobasidium sp. AG-Ba]|nr:Retrovirus-related Pol polyprotein from transposon [Ceratobasidium sp. AG-Ba]